MTKEILDNIFNEHLYQFVITLVVILSYVALSVSGRPTGVLESIVLVITTFWFANAANRTQNSTINTKLNNLENKLSTQELKAHKVPVEKA